MKKSIRIFLIIIIFLILILAIIRLINPKQIDDVSPEIPCEQYLEKADVLWVIPFFNNKSISENQEWCKEILSLNKTLGLHGVYHTYWEFKTTRNQEYLDKGIQEFEDCFGFRPEKFKPPNLRLNKENKKLIKNNLKLKNKLNQLTHKVYHCNNSGILSNEIIDIF